MVSRIRVSNKVEKFLESANSKTGTDLGVQIKKREMSDILLSFYKRTNS